MRAALVWLAVAVACHATPRADDRAARQLEELFASLAQQGRFSGAVVVGTADRIIWQRGYGYANVERRVLFTPETAGDGASLAKTFTAALVLALHEERALDLDAPVQRLLPELPYPSITLRHLLSHASGIPVLDYDYFDSILPAGELRTTERLLAVIAERAPPLSFEPGSQFTYSSFGYDLAALAAARAAGRPFGELLDARVFRPLGITSAFLRPGPLAAFPGVRTLGYRDGKVHDVFDNEAFHGGSNLYISARDLHRWNVKWISTPDSMVHAPARIGSARSGLSLGSWYRAKDDTAHWYPGHLQGFHSVVFRNARYSIVYIANNTLDPWLHHAIVRAIAAIVEGRSPPALAPPDVVAVGKTERDRLVGAWTTEDGERIDIEAAPALAMRSDGVRYAMVAMSETAFYVPGLDYIVGFARDSDGEISRMCVSTNVDERWATRSR